MKTVLSQKGYRYASVKPFQIGTRKLGNSVSTDGSSTEIRTPLYRILAGLNEDSTALIMFQNRKNDWILEVETSEGDACLDVFFASHGVTKCHMRSEVLKWLNNGFEILEDCRGRLCVK